MKVRVVNLRRTLTPALSRFAGEGVKAVGRYGLAFKRVDLS